MNPRIIQAALGAVLLIGVLGSASLGIESCGKNKENYAYQNANIAKGEGSVHEDRAKNQDAVVRDLQAKVDSSITDVSRLTKERDALLRKLASKMSQMPPDNDPEATVAPRPMPMADERDAVITKDAELIQAQVVVITNQAKEISVLTTSRDEWKATSDARLREAAGLRIALDAQRSVTNASRWTGRIQGFTAGIVLGLAGGRYGR